MHKIITSVLARVAKGMYITLGAPELLSRGVIELEFDGRVHIN